MATTPESFVDALNSAFGKQTTQRAAHAKGVVLLGKFVPSADAGDAERRFGGAGQRGNRTRAHVLAGALACRHRTRGRVDSVPQQDVSGILRAPSSVPVRATAMTRQVRRPNALENSGRHRWRDA